MIFVIVSADCILPIFSVMIQGCFLSRVFTFHQSLGNSSCQRGDNSENGSDVRHAVVSERLINLK